MFPLRHELGVEPFTGAVAAPRAVAHMGMGDFESLCHYEPLGRAERSTMNINEVLFPAGMTTIGLEEAFVSDLDYHPEAIRTGFGRSLLFQFWLTSFTQGIIARGMLEPADATTFDKQLDTAPWARVALDSFAPGALRRTCPGEALLDTTARVTPLCSTGMRAGFAAVESWPGLRALWNPDENDIRPRWNAGTRRETP
ncbi:hypothetical protein AB0M46_38735 [Dactylosporangium sp. NPDC051485]|uniref:hypothetical protein n=1 Tax=Dactylosporangium sp. NPDC051485 TaxID=3154846 RepID=UPI003427DB96